MGKLQLFFFLALILSLNFIPDLARAQESNDAYDPFIDYNEFEVADEEEADTNFFRNGRLMTAGLFLGQRRFTGGMSEVFSDNTVLGLYLSYFFDLRFAMQFSYMSGSHGINVKGPTQTATGDSSISSIGIDFKYYINTQNVTKGLAAVNPYLLAGLSSVSRESTVDGQPEFSKDSAMAFDAGAGVEFPIMRNKMYFGGQVLYQLVNFKDENTELTLDNGSERTGKKADGDMLTIMGVLGINF